MTMRITQINGTNMELTEAIKARVEKRLSSLEKFCLDIEPCDVAVDVGKTTKGQNKGKIFRAEFNLTVPGTLLRAETVAEDLYVAIDLASKDLKRQVKEYRKKHKQHK
ncbi:ribosome-associated translation inhibitor RaiA [Candidatus Parcubacteria bacterium]|nr:MAG: ribosome-associated translation inhibitor RaiA [Candidatus Parcubacteria bacterium]